MRFLVISQVYWPDSVSTAQHLADLCEQMASDGHEVLVYSSCRIYENPKEQLPLSETHHGVTIRRIWITGFDKSSVLGRVINFGVFNALLALRLLFTPAKRYDAMIGMTSPPMVSWIGANIAKLKGKRFFYWAMDLQPELAIQAGMLRANSWLARCLRWMGDSVVAKATHTFALDRYMADYLRQRTRRKDGISVARLWPVVERHWEGERCDNPFRMEHGFGDRCVIMYSGNHAVVHPLDTLLKAAQELRDDPRFLFVFIGGGVRVKDVREWKNKHQLANILQLPYQPRSRIHLSLSSADIHVVILGDGQVGYTHPNKVYGAMMMARPFLYIGPSPSHISDIVSEFPGNLSFRHDAVSELSHGLIRFYEQGEAAWKKTGETNRRWAQAHLDPHKLRQAMIDRMTSADPSTPAALLHPSYTE